MTNFYKKSALITIHNLKIKDSVTLRRYNSNVPIESTS